MVVTGLCECGCYRVVSHSVAVTELCELCNLRAIGGKTLVRHISKFCEKRVSTSFFPYVRPIATSQLSVNGFLQQRVDLLK